MVWGQVIFQFELWAREPFDNMSKRWHDHDFVSRKLLLRVELYGLFAGPCAQSGKANLDKSVDVPL